MSDSSPIEAVANFLLDAVQAQGLLQLYIFTLRRRCRGVNESAGDCEQAVIPVADTQREGRMSGERAKIKTSTTGVHILKQCGRAD
jgi:hypothetical protein